MRFSTISALLFAATSALAVNVPPIVRATQRLQRLTRLTAADG